MLCGRCFDSVALFDETTGFGTKFIEKDGKWICEHCDRKNRRALENLEELKKRKQQKKEARHVQESQEGLEPKKRGRPRKHAVKIIKTKTGDGRGSFWKTMTPEQRQLHVQKMQAGRLKTQAAPAE